MPDETVESQPESSQPQETPLTTVDDAGYKATLKKIRSERDAQAAQVKELSKKLEEFQKQFEGIDPQKFAEYKQQVVNAEEERQRTVEEQARLIKEKENMASQLGQKVTQLEQQLEMQTRTAAVRQAFFDAGGKKGNGVASFVDMVMPYALERIAKDEQNNLVVIQKGSRLIDYDVQSGKAKDLTMLMAEFASDPVLGTAFEPRSQASGGGFVQGIKPGQPQLSVDELMKLPPGEMARIGREIRK